MPCPPQFLDNLSRQINLDFLSWEKYNHTVMTLLYSSLIEEKMGKIVSFSTAYDIWTSLGHSYDSSSITRVLSLKMQLHLD